MQRRKAVVNFLDSLEELPCLEQPTPDLHSDSQHVIIDGGYIPSTSVLRMDPSVIASSSNHGEAENANPNSISKPEGLLLPRAAMLQLLCYSACYGRLQARTPVATVLLQAAESAAFVTMLSAPLPHG